MVSIQEVRTANSSLQNNPAAQSLTAVFTGATNGIGKATLEAFARHTASPTAIIVGRSEKAFAPSLQALETINPNGQFTFLEADISLIKNVDAVTKRISEVLGGRKVDLLSMSQGYLSFVGRETNADGFDNSIALRYYGRVRLTENLMPHLNKKARVLSVLAGSQEGKIFEDDLDLERNYSLTNANNQVAAMMTLTFDHLAKQNPDKSFLHAFPGVVSTGLLGRSATGLLGYIFRWVVEPVLGLFVSTAEDSGERMLHYSTREEFETGSWALDTDGTSKENEVLKGYRQRNFADNINEHNQAMFQRALSR